MNTHTLPESDRDAQREAIERVIAHYPDIAEDELHGLLDYFRREASARDQALIASNPDIHDRYRQLCEDHRLDRLGMVETIVAVLLVFLVTLVIIFVATGVWEL